MSLHHLPICAVAEFEFSIFGRSPGIPEMVHGRVLLDLLHLHATALRWRSLASTEVQSWFLERIICHEISNS